MTTFVFALAIARTGLRPKVRLMAIDGESYEAAKEAAIREYHRLSSGRIQETECTGSRLTILYANGERALATITGL